MEGLVLDAAVRDWVSAVVACLPWWTAAVTEAAL